MPGVKSIIWTSENNAKLFGALCVHATITLNKEAAEAVATYLGMLHELLAILRFVTIVYFASTLCSKVVFRVLFITKFVSQSILGRCASGLVRAVNAIHGAGVLHRDIRMPNLLWNEETKRVMVIDFERAEIVKAIRRALLPMSPNRKKKRTLGAKEVDGEDNMVDTIKEDPKLRLRVALDISAAQMMFASTVEGPVWFPRIGSRVEGLPVSTG